MQIWRRWEIAITESILITRLLYAAGVLAVGVLLGVLFEKVILKKLKAVAYQTQWECDEIVVSAVRGKTIYWFTLAALDAALNIVVLPADIADLIERALLVLFIFSVTLVVSNIAVGLVNIYARKAEGVVPSASICTNVTILLVFLIGMLVVMQSLGISITPILTALGVGGVAVALALQDTLSNFFSGVHILIASPIKPGDYIKLDSGEDGFVVDITWRNTAIRTLRENMIIIPNSKLASAIITNYSLPDKEVNIVIPLGVDYSCDLGKVERVTLEVAKAIMKHTKGGVAEYEPSVRFYSFGECRVEFNVILRTKEYADQFLVRHKFIKKLNRRFQEEGIEISPPVRAIYWKDGTTPADLEEDGENRQP